MRHRVVRFERERRYAMSPREAWRLLANTDNVNRNIGLPSVEFSAPEPADVGFVRKAAAKAFGVVPIRWTEYPFDWVRERRYEVRREFQSGPLALVEGGVELEPVENGVLVRVFSDFTPKGLLGRLVIGRIGPQSIERLFAYCDRYLSRKYKHRADPTPVPRPPRSIDQQALDRLLDRLRETPIPQELIGMLRERLLEGTDAQVLRVRPYALADAWRADRQEVLRLFLHATRVGLFNLTWELLCPTCRVPKGEATTLGELPGRFHCETCGIDYESAFDRRVELRFSVHPRVRRADDDVYCIGGPFRVPHVVAQQSLKPHETRTLQVPVPGALELRTMGPPRRFRLRPDSDRPPQVDLVWSASGWHGGAAGDAGGEEVGVPTGEMRLSLTNDTDAPVVAVLEEAEAAGDAVTAAEVTVLQEFRDLFSSEVLAPGQEVGVQGIALLFSDLKGSTALYEGVGDASAYRRVNRHFDLLKETIARHRGTVVKTIGDAVMGAFVGIQDALEAALAVQGEIEAWCRAQGIEPPLVLRIGLHEGPVVAVNANGRLDYFGRTVNVAARLGRESEGGDVVLLREVFEAEPVQSVLAGDHARVEEYTTRLRGIDQVMHLVRLRPEAVS